MPVYSIVIVSFLTFTIVRILKRMQDDEEVHEDDLQEPSLCTCCRRKVLVDTRHQLRRSHRTVVPQEEKHLSSHADSVRRMKQQRTKDVVMTEHKELVLTLKHGNKSFSSIDISNLGM